MTGPDERTLDAEQGAGALDKSEFDTVGMLLRADRLRRGQQLAEVSKILRIQFSYLNAIEQGKYENLPRGPYGLGFVRTYADYLGLDADEIVRRFKHECQHATERSRLVFPTPEQETSIPSGTVVVVSVALALAAYGVWYYTQTQDRSVAELVEPVPDRLVDLTSDQNRAAPQPVVETRPLRDAAAADVPQEPAEEPGVPQGRSEQIIETGVETPLYSAASSTISPPPVTVTDGVVEEDVEEDVEDVEDGVINVALTAVAGAPAEPQPAAGALAEAADRVLIDDGGIDPGEGEAVVGNVASELAAIPAVPELGGHGSDMVDAGASRIVIRATDRSWVRVLGADDKVLLTRMLMPGDVYEAPNEPELSLEAGNAGALEIEVDGTKLPPIGGFGEVVANYSLKPDALLAEIE